MGTVQTFGRGDPTTLHLYKGYPQIEREGSASTVTYKYWCGLAYAAGLLPAAYAACPLGGYTSLPLYMTTVAPNGLPGLCDVTLAYKHGSASSSSSRPPPEDGSVVKSSTISWQEVPLDDARLVSSGILSSGDVTSLRAKGHQTYGVGSVEYSYTEYLASFSWTEAALTSGIGGTGAPEGLSSATSANWAFVGATVRTTGTLTEKTRTWRYNRLGWTP